MKPHPRHMLMLSAVLLVAGCDDGAAGKSAAASATATATATSDPGTEAPQPAKEEGGEAAKSGDVDLSDPRKSIAAQLELLKSGDAEKLKSCFTDRQRERITPEAVTKGQQEAGKMTLEELVGDVEEGEFEGKKTAKIKMKNGRTLTTLVLTDGKWLADTVWFK